MNNITGFLALIGGASKLASVLQHVDTAKYETELKQVLADGEKLIADMKAIEEQAVADAQALKPQA